MRSPKIIILHGRSRRRPFFNVYMILQHFGPAYIAMFFMIYVTLVNVPISRISVYDLRYLSSACPYYVYDSCNFLLTHPYYVNTAHGASSYFHTSGRCQPANLMGQTCINTIWLRKHLISPAASPHRRCSNVENNFMGFNGKDEPHRRPSNVERDIMGFYGYVSPHKRSSNVEKDSVGFHRDASPHRRPCNLGNFMWFNRSTSSHRRPSEVEKNSIWFYRYASTHTCKAQ